MTNNLIVKQFCQAPCWRQYDQSPDLEHPSLCQQHHVRKLPGKNCLKIETDNINRIWMYPNRSDQKRLDTAAIPEKNTHLGWVWGPPTNTLMSMNLLHVFPLLRSSDVFKICGSMQFLSGLSLLIGLLSFPAGWDNDEVRGVCGSEVDIINTDLTNDLIMSLTSLMTTSWVTAGSAGPSPWPSSPFLTWPSWAAWPTPWPARRSSWWRWRSPSTWTPAPCITARSTLALWETTCPSPAPGSPGASSQWCWCLMAPCPMRGELHGNLTKWSFFNNNNNNACLDSLSTPCRQGGASPPSDPLQPSTTSSFRTDS